MDKYFPHKELSYKIIGLLYKVRSAYGNSQKEIIYQNALVEELEEAKISYKREVDIPIISLKTKKRLGNYRADFLIDDKIILEIKAVKFTFNKLEQQVFSYLKSTPYEVGYLVNFGSSQFYFKRYILTNNRKAVPSVSPKSAPSVSPGFTLMELLIIVALVALIAIGALVLFNPMQQIGKGYDAKRKHDLSELSKAYEDYYNDKGCYPTGSVICYDTPKENNKGLGVGATLVGYSCNICGSEDTIRSFSPYMSVLPCDPEHQRKDYLYQYDPSSCPSWYRLYTDFSNENDVESTNLGCNQGGCGLKYPPAPTPQYGYDYGVSNTNLEVSSVYNCIDNGSICNTCNTYDECIADSGCPNENKIYGSRGICCIKNPGSCP